MDRRQFLQRLGAIGATAVASIAGTSAPRIARTRPFAWADAASRTGVDGIVISPAGDRFALEVTRPLSSAGRFAGAGWGALLNPRGEIWLLDEQLKRPEKLACDTEGSWSASFSPDGRHLAALTLVDSGRVGVNVWDLKTGKYDTIRDVNIELFYSTFRTADCAYGGPSGFFQVPRRYIWLDANSLLAVDHGAELQQSLLAVENLAPTEAALRQRTGDGQVAVRVWEDHAPTCGSGSRLVRLRLHGDEHEVLYTGDVRGISLSPDRRLAALLIATSHLSPAPDAPIRSGLLQTTPGDDLMVELKLSVVDVLGQANTYDVQGVKTVGATAPSRLPVWSSDGFYLAVATRETYTDLASSGDDAAWGVCIKSREARKWTAVSALDAELLSALITTDELGGDSVIQRRPRAIRKMDYTVGGQILGGAWQCGDQQVILWNAPQLILITPTETLTVPGNFVSVQPPVKGHGRDRTMAIGVDGKTQIVTTWADAHKVEDMETRRGWELLELRAKDGGGIYKDDSDAGTYLLIARCGRRPRKSSLTFNTYFRNVLRPESHLVTRLSNGSVGGRGVLQLPIGHRMGERHPVIIWAYPNSTPSLDEQITRQNSYASVVYPLQYLLTRGFGVFHAPFPVAAADDRVAPMRAAVDAVVPWLDVLDRHPAILAGAYGFFGHSNAGYVALGLEALTNRFKAIVAWGTFPDIGYDTLHSSAVEASLACAGNIVQSNRQYYEDPRQPYNPQPAPPWREPGAYIRSDPLFNLGHAVTPLLLVEGEFDTAPSDMESVYSILYGRGVPVELAYYWGEGHVFGSRANIHDTWLRTERFFRKYLHKQ